MSNIHAKGPGGSDFWAFRVSPPEFLAVPTRPYLCPSIGKPEKFKKFFEIMSILSLSLLSLPFYPKGDLYKYRAIMAHSGHLGSGIR